MLTNIQTNNRLLSNTRKVTGKQQKKRLIWDGGDRPKESEMGEPSGHQGG